MPRSTIPTSDRDLVTSYLAAHARGDVDEALALFTTTAVVTDDGTSHHGRVEIHGWLTRSTSGADYTYTASTTPPRLDGERWTVTRHLEGDFPGGVVDLRYLFTLAGPAISALTIEPV